jgi:uroporphyrinogen decarboxylase
MTALTSRQRVLRALTHQEPDRVPIDVGGALCSISQFAYRRLLAHLGWSEEIVIAGLFTQVVRPSPRMLARLGSDFAHISAGPPDVKLGRTLAGSADAPFDAYVTGNAGHTLMDEWGVVWRRAAYYYDMVDFPLKEASSMADLAGYRWPDPRDPGRVRGLAERARAGRAEGRAVTLDPLAGDSNSKYGLSSH